MSKAPVEPPQIPPEQWQMGMEFFQRFLKKIKIKREGAVVHVDWIFEFPTEEVAKAFVKAAQLQMAGHTETE